MLPLYPFIRCCGALLVASIIVIGACRTSDDSERSNPGAHEIPGEHAIGARPSIERGGERNATAHDGPPIDACRIADNPEAYASVLEHDAGSFLRGDDSCVLAAIEKIMLLYAKEPRRWHLVVLDSISRASDGYVSEQLAASASGLFFSQPKATLDYLSRSAQDARWPLRRFITESWSLEVAAAADTLRGKSRLRGRLDSVATSEGFDRRERAYLAGMYAEIGGSHGE